MQEYQIETKRLGLRLFKKEDIDYLAELNNDPDVRLFFPDGVQSRQGMVSSTIIRYGVKYHHKTSSSVFLINLFKCENGRLFYDDT